MLRAKTSRLVTPRLTTIDQDANLAGRMLVRVYSPAPELEQVLAPFPGVEFTPIPAGYAAAPADLPQTGPYVLCVDKEEQAKAIRAWLPRTVAVFQVASERRGRNAAPGFD